LGWAWGHTGLGPHLSLGHCQSVHWVTVRLGLGHWVRHWPLGQSLANNNHWSNNHTQLLGWVNNQYRQWDQCQQYQLLGCLGLHNNWLNQLSPTQYQYWVINCLGQSTGSGLGHCQSGSLGCLGLGSTGWPGATQWVRLGWAHWHCPLSNVNWATGSGSGSLAVNWVSINHTTGLSGLVIGLSQCQSVHNFVRLGWVNTTTGLSISPSVIRPTGSPSVRLVINCLANVLQ